MCPTEDTSAETMMNWFLDEPHIEYASEKGNRRKNTLQK